MSKRIKLIHNRKENESSYYYGFDYTDKINNNCKEIINKSIQELSFDKNRKLKIYTWGEKNKDTKEPKCQVTFDLINFSTKIADISKKEVNKYTGKDEVIQNSIIQHPAYNLLIEKIINQIENNNLSEISFVCNHGKHRSVGFAEILKKYYYPDLILKHINLNF